ncbi:MAG: hypothetical protein AAF490_09765 [Chloroflexota bacterium]
MRVICLSLIGIVLILSAGCLSDSVENTAVSRSAPISSATIEPTTTQTHLLTPTIHVTIAATATSTPSPPPEPAVEAFVDGFLQVVNSYDYENRLRLSNEPFILGQYPALIQMNQTNNVFWGLIFQTLPATDSNIRQFEIDADNLAPSLRPAALFPEESEQVTVVGSSGWGANEDLLGLIYVLNQDGANSLGGLVFVYDNFTSEIALETQPSVEGLTYSVRENGVTYWKTTGGLPLAILTRTQRATLNPSQTVALEADWNSVQIELIDLSANTIETLSLPGNLMAGVEQVLWLDDETAVLRLTREGPIGQMTIGNIVLLDVPSRQFTVLEGSDHSPYANVTASPQKQIAFFSLANQEFMIWQDNVFHKTPITDFTEEGFVLQPTLSPDGNMLVGVHGSSNNPYGFYLFDLTAKRIEFLHPFRPVPGDAIFLHNTNWSPDGKWVALEPFTGSPFESGVRLINIENGEKQYLGPGSKAPIWLNSEQLVYTAVHQNKVGLQMIDVNSNTAVWLDTPQFDVSLDALIQFQPPKIIPIAFAP